MDFFKRLNEILRGKRDKSYFLFQFDIDRFKLINELHGTAVGDDVFCVCTDRSREETISLVNQIHSEVKQYSLAFRFFLPTGIVEIKTDSTDSASGICDKATLAQRKIKGNNLRKCCFYETKMGKQLNRERLLIFEMEQALQESQFELWFQPQYDMRSGKMICAEALARWQHPKLGFISPIEFITLFERNGFIIKLDKYIWEHVCRCIRDWTIAGLSPPAITVNV